METVDNIRDQVASRSQQSDSSLTESSVDAIVEQCGENVSAQRGQKDQRDDGVREFVVRFEL